MFNYFSLSVNTLLGRIICTKTKLVKESRGVKKDNVNLLL